MSLSSISSALAPSDTLRCGINISIFLLVSSSSPSGDPAGVAPDMVHAIAARSFDQIVKTMQGEVAEEVMRKEEPAITVYSVEDDGGEGMDTAKMVSQRVHKP